MPARGQKATPAQLKALKENNERRKRERIARQMAGSPAEGSEGVAGSSVASGSVPTPVGVDNEPLALVVGDPSAGPEDDDDTADPSWSERLRSGRATEKPKRQPTKTGLDPTAKEWEDFLADKLLRWLIALYVSWLCAPLELDTADQRALIPPQEERHRMTAPLAKLAAGSSLNERVGRKIMDADDALDALVTFALWFDSTRPILKQRRRAKRQERIDEEVELHTTGSGLPPAQPPPMMGVVSEPQGPNDGAGGQPWWPSPGLGIVPGAAG